MKAFKLIVCIIMGLCALVAIALIGIGETGEGVFLLLLAGATVAVAAFAKPPEKGWAKKAAAQNREAFRALSQQQQAKQQAIDDRIAAARAQGLACCPKCGSTSLTANKKGFGVGKAVIGAAAIGAIGLTAGNIGAKKITVTCLNCGHQFKPGGR